MYPVRPMVSGWRCTVSRIAGVGLVHPSTRRGHAGRTTPFALSQSEEPCLIVVVPAPDSMSRDISQTLRPTI